MQPTEAIAHALFLFVSLATAAPQGQAMPRCDGIICISPPPEHCDLTCTRDTSLPGPLETTDADLEYCSSEPWKYYCPAGTAYNIVRKHQTDANCDKYCFCQCL